MYKTDTSLFMFLHFEFCEIFQCGLSSSTHLDAWDSASCAWSSNNVLAAVGDEQIERQQ